VALKANLHAGQRFSSCARLAPALNLPRNRRFASALSVLSVLAVIGLLTGGLTPAAGVVRGAQQGTLLADAGRWDHPFLRAESPDIAKGAPRDRRDVKNPIGKKFTALLVAPRLLSAPLNALTPALVRDGVRPPLLPLSTRSPRGPPGV
jgi:hypothetical protein